MAPRLDIFAISRGLPLPLAFGPNSQQRRVIPGDNSDAVWADADRVYVAVLLIVCQALRDLDTPVRSLYAGRRSKIHMFKRMGACFRLFIK